MEKESHKVKSCFLCKRMVGTDGEICPRLAAKYSKVFMRDEFAFAPLLVDILYSTCGCSEFEYNADEKSRQAANDIHLGKAMELLKNQSGSHDDSKEDIEAANIISPVVKVDNLTVNIRCINK